MFEKKKGFRHKIEFGVFMLCAEQLMKKYKCSIRTLNSMDASALRG